MLSRFVKSKNIIKTLLQIFIGLELIWCSDCSKRILFLPDCFKSVIVVQKRFWVVKLGFIIVPVTFDLTDLQAEVSTLPEIKWVCLLYTSDAADE